MMVFFSGKRKAAPGTDGPLAQTETPPSGAFSPRSIFRDKTACLHEAGRGRTGFLGEKQWVAHLDLSVHGEPHGNNQPFTAR